MRADGGAGAVVLRARARQVSCVCNEGTQLSMYIYPATASRGVLPVYRGAACDYIRAALAVDGEECGSFFF